MKFKLFLLPLFCSLLVPLAVLAAPQPSAPIAKAQPNSRSIELNEKGVAALNSKDPGLAEEYFRQAVAADRMNLTASLNLSVAYVANGKEGAAVTLLEDLAKQIPDDPAIYSRLAEAYFSNGKAEQAAKNYEKALKLDPKYPKASARLGALYTLMDKPEQAAKYFEQAVALDPKDSDTLANLAATYLAVGKPNDSVRAAKQAIQLKVTPEAYVTLGSAYEAMKDLPNAIIAFERAASLGDSRPELAKKIESLKEIS